jgi:hypothetical protein
MDAQHCIQQHILETELLIEPPAAIPPSSSPALTPEREIIFYKLLCEQQQQLQLYVINCKKCGKIMSYDCLKGLCTPQQTPPDISK